MNYYDVFGAQGDGVDRSTTAAVKAEIDRLIEQYGRFDGFFLDEMNVATDPTILSKHADLAAYIRNKGCIVVQNPGSWL